MSSHPGAGWLRWLWGGAGPLGRDQHALISLSVIILITHLCFFSVNIQHRCCGQCVTSVQTIIKSVSEM